MLLLRLIGSHGDETLVERLGLAGIEAQSLSSHYAGRHRQQGLLLGFAGFTEADLKQAARRLMEELAE